MINFTHKNFVADIVFIPGQINMDKRNPSEGKVTHFFSCSEDGIVHIWDMRNIDKDNLKKNPDILWKPINSLHLFRMDGTGELGLSRILLSKT